MMQSDPYSGVENLEIMHEAVNYNRYLLNTICKHAPLRGRVLDFGAGSGEFAAPIATLGFDVTALEPDASLRTVLATKRLKAVEGLDELADHSFEYVYTLNVLEHIEDDTEVLRQLYRKLSSRGTLLIYVPAFPILYTSMDAKVGHVRRYTRASLVAKVAAAGFNVESIAHVDSLGFLATLLFKATQNKDGNISRSALKLYDRLAFPLSRACDVLAQRWFGKNLLLLASKGTR